MRRRSMDQPFQMSRVNIMLLGLTGAGKSASGNTIIGGDRNTFEEGYSFESKTKICTAAHAEVGRQRITVIDTVGLSDTKVKITDVQTKIEQIFDCAHNGVDVFLLVIRLGDKFTEEVITAMKWIQENFGAKVLKHTIVLFTHADHLQEPVEDFLGECESLRSLVDQCSGGFHVFNNKDEDQSQVTELLDKINRLRMKNVYRRYNEQDYKETQDKILCRKYVTGVKIGGGAGILGGAVLGAVASQVGAVELTTWKAAAVGALGGLVIGTVAAWAGVCLFARKYTSRQNI